MLAFFVSKKKFLSTIFPWCALFSISAVVTWVFYFAIPDEALPNSLYTAGTGKAVRMFFVSTLWLMFFFGAISHFHFSVRSVFSMFVFVPAAFFLYVAHVFRTPFNDRDLTLSIAETHWLEAKEFLGAREIVLVFVAVMGIFAFSWLLGKIRPPLRFRKTTICLLFLACVLMKNSAGAFAVRQISDPLDDIRAERNGGDGSGSAMLAALSRVEDWPQSTVCDGGCLAAAPIVFLHVGESVRADHAPFNGYERDTMPRMRKEFEAGALVSFPKCVSFANYTRNSVLGMMTPAAISDPVIRAGSFVPALRENGVRTTAFFSSVPDNYFRDSRSCHDVPLVIICRKFEEKITTEKTSDVLMPRVSKTLVAANSPSFFLYYGEGAHTPFRKYNEAKYGVFARTGSPSEKIAASYDNCIVATDDFCGNAIDALRDKSAVYIYAADHGLELGTYGSGARPLHSKNVRHVLFFVWCSEKFRHEHADEFRALEENCKRLGVISHDFIYHSVLGLFGIRTPFYDETFNLFSPRAKAFPCEMPNDRSLESGLRFESGGVSWGRE